jgi:glutamine synthetase
MAITPFDGIVDNPFGPLDEFRQIPVDGASVTVEAAGDIPAMHLHLARTVDGSGASDCCPRSVCEGALADLHAATGWTLLSAFEHEFTAVAAPFRFGHVYSVESIRLAARFAHDVARALRPLGLECFEPEFGKGQFEASCSPAPGVTGPDRAILTREVIREIGRRHGVELTFSPKPTPASAGNGLHVHFSFRDDAGRPALFDGSRPASVSTGAASFIAGVIRHMSAITALSAPAPVSYLRLGPSHWSCGYAAFGVQNREAALRVCLSPDPEPGAAAAAANLEIRSPDATCNPYLATAALARAGLQGLREKLPLPPIVSVDPAELSEAERAALGVRPLPATLTQALDALEADAIARTWLPPRLYQTFMGIKRMEAERFAGASPDEIARAYRELY